MYTFFVYPILFYYQMYFDELNNRFGLISESLTEVVIEIKDDTITYTSPVFEKLLGYSPHSINNKPYHELTGLIHPDDRIRVMNYKIESTINRANLTKNTYRVQHKNGNYLWVESHEKREYNEAGKLSNCIITLKDITEKRNLELELQKYKNELEDLVIQKNRDLKQSERILKQAQRIAKIGHWTLDICQNLLQWSDEAYHIFGVELGKNISYEFFLSFVHIDDKEKVSNSFFESLSNKTNYDIEYKILSKDGQLKYLNEKCFIEYDTNKEPIYALGTIQDITDRKKIELENRKLSTAITQSPVSIVITDIDGNIEYVNPNFCKLTGYSIEEAIGQNPRILKTDHTSLESYKELWDTILSGNVWNGEFLNVKKNKEHYWESAVIAPVKDQNGKITNLIAIKQDITLQKLTAEQLKKNEEFLIQARKDAESANLLKSQFLANMSHEIRTPMNGIIGFLDLLEETIINKEQLEYIKEAQSAGKALLHLLNDILDVSRIEAGKLSIDNSLFSVRNIVEDSCALFRKKIKEKGLRFGLVISPTVPDEIIADPSRLQQILNNLISNAVKFTESGGIHVSVDLKEDNEKEAVLFFEISDTGIGISHIDIDKLFKPFTQVDSSITRKYGGSGLGLAISRELVYLMGGNLIIDSQLGKGSKFSFTIQCQKTSHTTTITNSYKEQNGNRVSHSDIAISTRIKVLLVEDNEMNQRLIKRMFHKLGIECDTASNGREAISAFQLKKYDIIFMDIQMPILDGYEATKEIRKFNESGKKVTIIAMTANAMEGDKEKCIEVGMDDYISKPVHYDTLISHLKNFCLK